MYKLGVKFKGEWSYIKIKTDEALIREIRDNLTIAQKISIGKIKEETRKWTNHSSLSYQSI